MDVVEIDQESMGAKLPLSLSETESMGAKLPQPLSEIEQCTVPNEQIHCPKTDNPLSEIEQSITETTTKNTTQITTNIKEVQDFFSAKAETPNLNNKHFIANLKRRKKMKPKPTEKPQDKPEDLPEEQPVSEFPYSSQPSQKLLAWIFLSGQMPAALASYFPAVTRWLFRRD